MHRPRELTIIAQDPAVRVAGRILTAKVRVPHEELGPGPRGHRAYVIDYDSTTHTLYAPQLEPGRDEWGRATNRELLGNPHFHAQNVYAIVMRTLARFELALGRRVSWGFGGHQIKIAPHALAGANAFYSRENEALLFGYFKSRGQGYVYTCLSHDIVAHETTHALLDGIRERYVEPSLPDQAAFHEGFADLVAVLSMFSLPEVVEVALPPRPGRGGWKLRDSMLLAVAKQLGSEVSGRQKTALRRSVELKPNRRLLTRAEFQDPHRRGEIFVAAVLNAFLDIWERRVASMSARSPGAKTVADRARVVEEGAHTADHLLTMAIRALDYAPPTDISFPDYLSALLTADFESSRTDSRYGLRRALLKSFARFGIAPASARRFEGEYGIWEAAAADLEYKHTHFEAMQRDPNEVFNFLWENRKRLGLYEEAYTRVQSVRPCMRVGTDGFVLRETVAEYVQALQVRAGELERLSPALRKPLAMPDNQSVTLYGGGALVFDEYGSLKYHVCNSVTDSQRQPERLRHLWESGYFDAERNEKEINGTKKRPRSDVPGRSWRLLSPPL